MPKIYTDWKYDIVRVRVFFLVWPGWATGEPPEGLAMPYSAMENDDGFSIPNTTDMGPADKIHHLNK